MLLLGPGTRCNHGKQTCTDGFTHTSHLTCTGTDRGGHSNPVLQGEA